MGFEAWSKANERDLARYVDPERVQLRLGVNRYDLARQPDGIRRIVEAIYDGLLGAHIRYAPEKYFPDQNLQQIRSPEEILEKVGEGTCLDLALLFCGTCLANDLLPMVIVIEGHALAAVSLTQLRGDWDAYDRHPKFDRGELSKENKKELISLIDSKNYIAVECTGFAQSSALPGGLPELAGRKDGVLAFDQAVAVGRAQLSNLEREFQYAPDIATLHELGMTPPYPVWDELFKAIRDAGSVLNRAKPFTTLLTPRLRDRFDKLRRYATRSSEDAPRNWLGSMRCWLKSRTATFSSKPPAALARRRCWPTGLNRCASATTNAATTSSAVHTMRATNSSLNPRQTCHCLALFSCLCFAFSLNEASAGPCC